MDYQFFREKGYFKFPPILQIEITQKCPLSCPQCYKNLDEKEMPFDFLKDSIINASRNGTKHIVLNGGEPFVYSKIFDVLEIVDRLDVQVTLFIGKSYREMIGAPGSSFFTQMENGILRYKVFYFTKKNE